MKNNIKYRKRPDWLKIKLPVGEGYSKTKYITRKYNLHTICESGRCPNIAGCWGAGTATFMILGDICTRACKFCNVKTGKPLPPNKNEPLQIAKSIQLMQLSHTVITSVDRDDLPDYGASIWSATIRAIKKRNPQTTLEVLIPDFNGDVKYIQNVIDEKPTVISHNLETVERLTPLVRSKAKYQLSLSVLQQVANASIVTKSGIMLGLGETKEEVLQTFDDMLKVGVSVVTLGQYLQPSFKHMDVQAYITPTQFSKYAKIAKERGFIHVESAPFVRSSFHAKKHLTYIFSRGKKMQSIERCSDK